MRDVVSGLSRKRFRRIGPPLTFLGLFRSGGDGERRHQKLASVDHPAKLPCPGNPSGSAIQARQASVVDNWTPSTVTGLAGCPDLRHAPRPCCFSTRPNSRLIEEKSSRKRTSDACLSLPAPSRPSMRQRLFSCPASSAAATRAGGIYLPPAAVYRIIRAS